MRGRRVVAGGSCQRGPGQHIRSAPWCRMCSRKHRRTYGGCPCQSFRECGPWPARKRTRTTRVTIYHPEHTVTTMRPCAHNFRGARVCTRNLQYWMDSTLPSHQTSLRAVGAGHHGEIGGHVADGLVSSRVRNRPHLERDGRLRQPVAGVSASATQRSPIIAFLAPRE